MACRKAPVAHKSRESCALLRMKPPSGWWLVKSLVRPEPLMSLPRTIADVLHKHVTLELECIDRLYLNFYQPHLQLERKVYYYLREQHGAGAVSSLHFQGMTKAFVLSIRSE